MLIGIPRESKPGETLVAATAKTVSQLTNLGYDVVVESGAGVHADQPDSAFVEAGVRVGTTEEVWAADVVVKVNAPTDEEIGRLRAGRHDHLDDGARPRPRAAGEAPGAGRDRRSPWTPCRGSRGRSRWTCSVLDGEHRGLPRRGRGRPRVRSVLHRPGDRRGQGPAGQGARRRCRCRRPRRDRCCVQRWARSCARPTRGPRSPTRSKSIGGAVPRASTSPMQRSPTDGYAKATSEDYRSPRPPRCTTSRRADVDIVITTALIPGRPRPEAAHGRGRSPAMKPG